MTKFEYCSYLYEVLSQKGAVFLPNGENIETSKEKIIDIINKLGKEEWELVSAIYYEDIEAFYFKRERNE
jgi:Domain of unknown function (DUF4177)